MGYPKKVHIAHGWLAVARAIMDAVPGERADLIEHQPAHAAKDVNGRAYRRTGAQPDSASLCIKLAPKQVQVKAHQP